MNINPSDLANMKPRNKAYMEPATPENHAAPAEAKKAKLSTAKRKARNGSGHHVLVNHGFRRSFVRIDGRELPYDLSGDVEVRKGRKGESIVMIGVLAERVNVNANKKVNEDA